MRINAYTVRYTFTPEDNPLPNFNANPCTTKVQTDAFNGLVTVTPLYAHDDAADPLR